MDIEIFDINKESVDDPTIKYHDLTSFHKRISHLLKSAKFHVLKVLKMKYQKLERKVKNQNDDNKEKSKLNHKQAEIEYLGTADLDILAKRIFANKYSEQDMERIGDKMSLEDRIVIRLFNVNVIKAEINKFRSEHSDWERLADDLLYKNTGGRIKLNRQKKIGSIPLANVVKETKINVKQRDETEPVLLIPVMEEKKRKEELTKKIDIKKKEQENKKQKAMAKELDENDDVLQIEDDAINTVDDMDTWEKDLGEEEGEEGEMDIFAPLDGSEKVAPKKKRRGGKKVNHNREQKWGNGEKKKAPSNSFKANKTKTSDQ